ncbi:MAG: hypothetical protein WD034_10350 [Parvibaculum sp.]|uniref:hypothetical protein n=1 Tax=Parvibaculum sp. TaxID=2024848 RepID=UPI0034A05D68
MSNFLMGIVGGFFLCVWALNANPVTATASLVERFQQIQVSFAAEPEPDPTLKPLPALLPPERPTANPYY